MPGQALALRYALDYPIIGHISMEGDKSGWYRRNLLDQTLKDARRGDRTLVKNREKVLSQRVGPWSRSERAAPIVTGSGDQSPAGPLPPASAPANTGVGSLPPLSFSSTPAPGSSPVTVLFPEEVPPQRRGQLGDLIPDPPQWPGQARPLTALLAQSGGPAHWYFQEPLPAAVPPLWLPSWRSHPEEEPCIKKSPFSTGEATYEPRAPETMKIGDWWLNSALYGILPNRLYWLLGANVIDSAGEDEWYALVNVVGLTAPHWAQERGPARDED